MVLLGRPRPAELNGFGLLSFLCLVVVGGNTSFVFKAMVCVCVCVCVCV